MNRFLAFVRKEWFHILRDYRTILILFGMPIFQIMLFGFAITNEIKDARIAILDRSKDYLSERLIHKILSTGYFKLDQNISNLSDIDATFRKGKVKEVIIIEENFASNLTKNGSTGIQLITDATDPNTGSTISGYVQSIILDFTNSMNREGNAGFRINTELKMRYNEDLKGVFMFVPGLITIILMLISAMMTSISLTREKELGTMEVLLASPMKPFQVILAKVIPYLVLSFSIAMIVLVLGYYVFGVPVRGSLVLLLLEILLFNITTLSLGILISIISQTQQVALMLSLMGLMLPTILLSGFVFPIENMPVILQLISHIIPAKWFIIIIKGIMLKGSGLGTIWKETVVILLFAIFFIGVSIKNFKIRLD
jgi:ABC-2 type transport system permease protein